jgi:hypothetical protein
MVQVAQKERRRTRRILLKKGPLLVYPEKNGQNPAVLTGTVYDLSPFGVRFSANQPCTADSKVALTLLTPAMKPAVKITGKVVRTIFRNDKECHVAVEFDSPDDQQVASIEEYIEMIKSAE